MTHIEKYVDEYEWEEEVCDACGHPVSLHYDEPIKVYDNNKEYMYTAVGCMMMRGSRHIENNPYPRCECMKAE